MGKRKSKKGKRITLTHERSEGPELCEVFKQLLADLANAPGEVRKILFDFSNVLPERLVSIEFKVTSRTSGALLFKPSQLLLDLALAVRTGNFDLCVIEHGHSFSSVDSGLVELPSLSTLEKLPIAGLEK